MKSHRLTAVWRRFFLIAGNIVFLFMFWLLLTTDETELRSAVNLKLFAAGLPVTALLCAGYHFLPKTVRTAARYPLLLLAAGYLLLFALQAVFIHFTYFYTGWDVGLMRQRVEAILAGQTMQDSSTSVIYSVNSNNLVLFYMQYLISKTGELFSMEQPYNLCIYFSGFCVSLSCFLGNLIIRKMTQSTFIRCLYTLVSTIYLLFSPWIVIPYSDTYGMLFVTLGLWAMLYLEKPFLKWPVLAFAAFIGYQVKPTCIFLLFAAFILFLPDFLTDLGRKWKELCILLVSCLLFFGAGQGIFPWIQHSLSFRIDPELRFPALHYMMIGLNTDSRGGFDEIDYSFTLSIPTYEERERLVKEKIEQRWNSMTPEQRKAHFTDKFFYIYNDGTFAWTGEGSFFETVPEHDNALFDRYLEVFHPTGKYFTAYCEFAQAVWLFLLFGILFTFLGNREQDSGKAFLMIVLCGLTLFLMMFEARARYLFLYSPAFLILSLCGYEGLFSAVSGKIKKHMDTKRRRLTD